MTSVLNNSISNHTKKKVIIHSITLRVRSMMVHKDTKIRNHKTEVTQEDQELIEALSLKSLKIRILMQK